MGEWAKDIHNRTLLAVRRFRDTGKADFCGGTLMSRVGLRLLGRLIRSAHSVHSRFRQRASG